MQEQTKYNVGMKSPQANATQDPGFFDGRFLVGINSWDATLHVGLSSDLHPPELRFQGGLAYIRGYDLEGYVVAPKAHRARRVRVNVSTFGEDIRFGPGEMDEVGQLYSIRRIRRSPTSERPS
jgi:hypothetical protein